MRADPIRLRGRAGTLSCWGDNNLGQLGDGTTVEQHFPVAVSGVTDATQVSAGEAFTCARHASGAVSCWGRNSSGQLGDGSMTSTSPVPVPVATPPAP